MNQIYFCIESALVTFIIFWMITDSIVNVEILKVCLLVLSMFWDICKHISEGNHTRFPLLLVQFQLLNISLLRILGILFLKFPKLLLTFALSVLATCTVLTDVSRHFSRCLQLCLASGLSLFRKLRESFRKLVARVKENPENYPKIRKKIIEIREDDSN